MPTIAEVASKYSKAPKLLVNELTKAYPTAAWNVNSAVPEEFLESLDKHAKQYDNTPAPGDAVKISGGQLTVTESADLILSDDGFVYGAVEAILEVQMQVMQRQGELDALELVSAYRDAKEATIGKFLEGEFNASKTQLATINQRTEKLKAAAEKKQLRTQALNSQLAGLKADLAKLPKI